MRQAGDTNPAGRAVDDAAARPGMTSDLYQAIFQAAPDGIILVNDRGEIRQLNDQTLKIFGYGPGELEGRSVDVLVPRTLRAKHEAHRAEYGKEPRARPMGTGLELSGVRKDGSQVPLEISLSPFQGAEGGGVIAIIRDLTERRRMRDFGTGSLMAAEEERRRIARDLHDETAQTLAALLMRLSLLERRLEGHPEAREVASVREAVHGTVEGVRRMARGLRPPELEDLGLAAALQSHVRERYPEGKVELALDGSEDRLGSEQCLVAYRIVQEALANATRHGEANLIRVEVQLAEDRRTVVLEISDDGRGFDLDTAMDAGAGLGLMGMEERALIAGGQFQIQTRPGEGTVVRVRIPMSQEEKE